MNTQTKNVISHLKNPAFYLVLLFLALLVVPAIVWDELSEEFRSKKLTNENRAKDNKKPLLNFSDIQKYPKKFQRYYNDAFPFREYLVWSSKKVTAPVTNYYSPIVVTGKDGFLFYTNAMEKYGDESKDFKEGCLWTHARVKRLVKQFDEIRKDLAEMGIDFCMFIAPNKMTIYPDKLPEKRKYKRAEMLRAEQFIAYAKKYAPQLKVVFTADVLSDLRKKVNYPLYYHEDTHWTELSAYASVRELVMRVNGKKALPPLEKAKILPERSMRKGGDLTLMLGKENPPAYQYHIVHVPGMKKVTVKPPAWLPLDASELRRSRNPHAPDPRKVWVYRDSFTAAMEPYISMYFREVDYFWFVPLRKIQFMGKNKPRLVIFQAVERNFQNIEKMDYFRKKRAKLEYFRDK